MGEKLGKPDPRQLAGGAKFQAKGRLCCSVMTPASCKQSEMWGTGGFRHCGAEVQLNVQYSIFQGL